MTRGLPHLRHYGDRDGEKRYEQLERILRLMQRIDGRPYCPPLADLARDLGVCERTIRRYLDAMSRAGVYVPPLFSEYQQETEA